MNHNKFNFKEGDMCVLDAKYANSSIVKILRFTPNQMYVTVIPIDLYDEENQNYNDSDTWETMTNRLTPATTD